LNKTGRELIPETMADGHAVEQASIEIGLAESVFTTENPRSVEEWITIGQHLPESGE
jgi:hypothetical protein